MSKIREYIMDGKIILGVDAGYGNYKTAHCTFPTAIIKSDRPPVFSRDYMEYDSFFYTFGEGHKAFVAEKADDEDHYVLTLAAIARELDVRGIYSARIHLAVGLPLKWVQAQRESFRPYMLQKNHVDLKYHGKIFSVDIADCTVVPQCYAAVAENLAEYKGMYMLADVGNGTINIMILNNGRASESRSWTSRLGVHQCFVGIQNTVMDKTGEKLPLEMIENYLRTGDKKLLGKYGDHAEAAARKYTEEVFDELREYGYNPELMKLHIMGGGSRIIESAGVYDLEKVSFDHDLRANAKGFEYFCYMKLRREQQGRQAV